jgi:hypothetical protein
MAPSQSTLCDSGNEKKVVTDHIPLPLVPLTVRLLLGMSVRNSLSGRTPLILIQPSTSSSSAQRNSVPAESSLGFSSSNDDVFSLMTTAYAVHVDLVH